MTGLIIVVIVLLLGYMIFRSGGKKKKTYALPVNTDELLEKHVRFYKSLDANDKLVFKQRIADFLLNVSVTGVAGVNVDDLDRLLVASGAIIPIFAFRDWRYNNISEVLLYNGTFSKDYRLTGDERNVLGMVGDGAMNRQMILSKPSLHSSFDIAKDGHNTVIHEFTHLIDKADGATDGIPEYLLDKKHAIPWVKLIHATISDMRRTGHSDIDLYGATNEAEFFAVVSEYFFEKPQMLQEHHPELYKMLAEMFGKASKS